MLATAATKDLEPHQRDVNTALLNKDLSENLHMEQLEDLAENEKTAHVCKLQKILSVFK